jgi:hypothetical protein
MFRPRPYLSFSQMTKFEMSPERFIAEYVRKEKQRITRNMAYGSQMATGLEKDEASGDPMLDLMMATIPKFEIMDKPIESPKGVGVWYERDKKNVMVPTITDGKEIIPLLAVPDTMRPDMSAFKEYKTSVRKWTKKMADESGQITFYATTIWLITGKIPADIELVNVPVAYQEGGQLSPTGELVQIPTRRTMVDVIRMTGRIKKAWAGIGELCEKEIF